MALLISDVGPTPDNFVGASSQRNGSGRILCLGLSADGQRIYAGSYAGVWRSDDAGRNFRQMSRPQPGTSEAQVPGALHAPHIFDIAVSPADPDILLVAALRSPFAISASGIWRSTDGGSTWNIALLASWVGQVVFAADDPAFVVAAIQDSGGNRLAISHDAGLTWAFKSINPVWHVAVGPLEGGSVRRVYAAGQDTVWYSKDGGDTWRVDTGTAPVVASRAATSAFIVANSNAGNAIPSFANATGDVVAPGPQALAIEPGNPLRIFLAAQGGTFGLSFFARDQNNQPIPDGTQANVSPIRLAGEGSLWTADFTNFESGNAAQWEAVPGPNLYSGTTTPSGVVYVQAHPTPAGYLLFFADQSSVYVCQGRPTNSVLWHRLDGKDASYDKRVNQLYDHAMMHVDPHGLVVSPDIDFTLKVATGVPSPYNQNSELDQYVAGTLWMANDGGVVWSVDAGENWQSANGLPTLDPINITGLPRPGGVPNLYIGTGDNDSFFSSDGGSSWQDVAVHLGDADAWFSDAARDNWVLQFAPRAGGFAVWNSGPYPDASDAANQHRTPPPPKSNASSGFVLAGYRPLLLTLTTEAAPADGDMIVIGTRSDGARALYRTQNISSINDASEWEGSSLAQQIGPVLPDPAPGMIVGVAQASGGHLNPRFYVSDKVSLWVLHTPSQTWRTLVPGGPTGRSASRASRTWADPYNPLLIYVLDSDAMRVSLDGGSSWILDSGLNAALSGAGVLDLKAAGVVRDMLFVRSEPFTRFAFGSVGVVYTLDGITWQSLLNATAFGGCPESGFFDGVGDPLDRTLYVEFEGRGIVRISGIPAPQTPNFVDFSLLDLAAVLGEA